ncbi:short-chain dehydrogenase [Pedobacter lusitanus]|uniref:Short-chain dehydrogenase n=1 Tax=Pedobacter lusitanus TaxID=1503925 RepID=A0A0D0F6S4_9SPHI|nr:SDR family oxidoreductase [Pedobacter lusitanus]KIO77293.1 short-chain dehydrogenase [Pedobacter lusitanus]
MNKLAGKTAVITGGNSGIGLATAQEFIALGAKVIITGRNQKSIDDAVAVLGENAAGIVSDSGDMQQVKNLGNQIKAISKKIDIIFINAGVGQFYPIDQVTEELFDQMMNVNFKGAYFSLQQLLPLTNDGGSVILNTSINAHLGMYGASVYASSKAALISLAKNLSLELIPRRIRVNAISPGPVATPMHSPAKMGVTTKQFEEIGGGILKQIPVGRFGLPEEIAKVAAFLASDDSSFMLGAELIVDGGFTV